MRLVAREVEHLPRCQFAGGAAGREGNAAFQALNRDFPGDLVPVPFPFLPEPRNG
jgi:hypothetical protein